jgi:molecular chaperone GrpE
MVGRRKKDKENKGEETVEEVKAVDLEKESSGEEVDETAAKTELSELEAAEKKWLQEKEELLDSLKRKQADIDNLRRISKMEQADAREYALYEFLSRLLPVLDNIDRALDSAHSAENIPVAFVDGLDMIRKQLLQLFEQEGVSMIESVGEQFDPNCHHAVLQVESEEAEPGTVLEELQRGYRHHKRILRPSMVKVCAE